MRFKYLTASCWEKKKSDFGGGLYLVRYWECQAEGRVRHLFQSLVTIKCHFILDFGIHASFQLVRAEKTQIKSRPISTANWDSGSLPADSFSTAHLAFDVLQVWSSLFKEAGAASAGGLGCSWLGGASCPVLLLCPLSAHLGATWARSRQLPAVMPLRTQGPLASPALPFSRPLLEYRGAF